MRLILPVLLSLVVIGCSARAPDPFPPPPEPPAPRAGLTLDDADYLYARFSPDGREIALAELGLVEGHESTQLSVLDLESGVRRIILSADSALGYGYYAASILELNWASESSLELVLHDGDVSATWLALDPESGRVLADSLIEGGADGPSGEEVVIRDRMADLFPTLAGPVLDHLFHGRSVRLPGGRGLIFQKDYAGEDEHVWLADLERERLQVLIPVSGDERVRLVGGITGAGATLFALSAADSVRLLVHGVDAARQVLAVPAGAEEARIRPLKSTAGGTIFLLRTGASSETGSNHLLRLADGGRVERISTEPRLFDGDVSVGGRVAVTVWEGERRMLRVFRTDR